MGEAVWRVGVEQCFTQRLEVSRARSIEGAHILT
jgi:hypothetical protein